MTLQSAGSPIPDTFGRVTALLEYSPRLKKAFIRAILPFGETLAPLEPGNMQNHIGMFTGMDHKFQVGISPLVLDEENDKLSDRHE